MIIMRTEYTVKTIATHENKVMIREIQNPAKMKRIDYYAAHEFVIAIVWPVYDGYSFNSVYTACRYITVLFKIIIVITVAAYHRYRFVKCTARKSQCYNIPRPVPKIPEMRKAATSLDQSCSCFPPACNWFIKQH
jgi:hypothetical protein